MRWNPREKLIIQLDKDIRVPHTVKLHFFPCSRIVSKATFPQVKPGMLNLPGKPQLDSDMIKFIRNEPELPTCRKIQVNMLIRGRGSETGQQELTLQMLIIKAFTVERHKHVTLRQQFMSFTDHLSATVMELREKHALFLINPPC